MNNALQNSRGFSLVEILLSVILLGLMITGISALYISGLQALDTQDESMLLASRLRSRMEVLVGTDFTALGNGSEVVSVNGKNYTIIWSVVPIDMDGDSHSEPNAMQVTVSMAGITSHSLTTIIVDNEGRVGKI